MSDVTGPIDFGGGGGGGSGVVVPPGTPAGSIPAADGSTGVVWIVPVVAEDSETITQDTSDPGFLKFHLSPTAAAWASRGSGSFTGQIKRITDQGPTGGRWFIWDGTVWRPNANYYAVLDQALFTGALNTTEQIAKQFTLPIGLLQAIRAFSIRGKWVKGGTTDAMTGRIRIGTAGTTADTQLATFALTSAQHTFTFEYKLVQPANTTIRIASHDSLSTSAYPNAATTTAYPTDITVPDSSANALIVSLTTQMAGSTDAGKVGQFELELFA